MTKIAIEHTISVEFDKKTTQPDDDKLKLIENVVMQKTSHCVKRRYIGTAGTDLVVPSRGTLV